MWEYLRFVCSHLYPRRAQPQSPSRRSMSRPSLFGNPDRYLLVLWSGDEPEEVHDCI